MAKLRRFSCDQRVQTIPGYVRGTYYRVSQGMPVGLFYLRSTCSLPVTWYMTVVYMVMLIGCGVFCPQYFSAHSEDKR